MGAENLYGSIPRVETHNTVRAYKEKAGRLRLVGSKCCECGQIWFPRRFTCPKCHSRQLQEYQCATTGIVTNSWVDTMGFPCIGYEDIDDRVIATILLDDGINIIAELCNVHTTVETGTRVKKVIREQKRDDTGNLMYGYKFEVVE